MAYPVAVIQCTVRPGEIDANRLEITRLAGEAARHGAKLIVLPEACVSDIYRGAQALAETIPGPSTEMLSRVAGDATLALPLLEKAADGKVYSSCALISASGIRGVARKTHLFRDASGHDSFRDEEVIARSDSLSIVDLGDVRAGVLLGFDAEFPESFRALTLRGADLIIVAQNSLEPDHAFLSAMALRNRIPIAVANRLGFRRVYPVIPEFSAGALSLVQDRDGTFLMRCRGGSGIFDADGTRVAQPKENIEAPEGTQPFGMRPVAHFQEEEVLIASLRIEEQRIQRATSPFLSERHEELYGQANAKKPEPPADQNRDRQGAAVPEGRPEQPEPAPPKPKAKRKPRARKKKEEE
ncbi:MAG TPA: carbon-nitrogen hydrolase family protein [Planctomycetota bacterium]|jgi:predicted amidohydrolase